MKEIERERAKGKGKGKAIEKTEKGKEPAKAIPKQGKGITKKETEKGKGKGKDGKPREIKADASMVKKKKKKKKGKKEGKRALKGDLMVNISEKLASNSLLNVETIKNPRGFTEKFVNEVTQNERLYGARVGNKRVTLVNPNKKKKAFNKKPPSKVPFNAKEKKKRKIYMIPLDCRKFSMYIPLHNLWFSYMEKLLGKNLSPNVVQSKLLRADFHGCLMTVFQSKCASYVGTCGIMVKETKLVFNIITRDDELKAIPKANSIFSFKYKNYLFNLHGNQLLGQSAERSSKKYKQKPTIDL